MHIAKCEIEYILLWILSAIELEIFNEMVLLLQTKANNYHRMRQIMTVWPKRKATLIAMVVVLFLCVTRTRNGLDALCGDFTWRDNYNVNKWVFVIALYFFRWDELYKYRRMQAKRTRIKKNRETKTKSTSNESIQAMWLHFFLVDLWEWLLKRERKKMHKM